MQKCLKTNLVICFIKFIITIQAKGFEPMGSDFTDSFISSFNTYKGYYLEMLMYF